jgi:hypothetical protein
VQYARAAGLAAIRRWKTAPCHLGAGDTAAAIGGLQPNTT